MYIVYDKSKILIPDSKSDVHDVLLVIFNGPQSFGRGSWKVFLEGI